MFIFIIKNYEDKIIKLLKETYGADLDEMSNFNEHLSRLKNIRDNEMREIIIEERTDNRLGKEIFETLIENLNKDCEINSGLCILNNRTNFLQLLNNLLKNVNKWEDIKIDNINIDITRFCIIKT